MKYDKNLPYNDLPLLPPKKEIENKKILKKTINANRSLAKLVGSIQKIPNEMVFIDSLLLQEAKSSSEIENIVTTDDNLYRAAISSSQKELDPQIKEVISYKDSLWEGFKFVTKNDILTTNLFVKIVNTIKKNDAGIRKQTGTKVINPATNEIIYVPPEGEAVIREKLKNIEDFINTKNDDLDPLVKMAIIHYQFEAIHPFYDGNGRTGRIINILFLLKEKILESPVFYMSRYIIEHKNEYYRNLRNVTEKGDWENWILYILDAVEEASKDTQNKLDQLCNLMKETEDLIKEKKPKLYSKELIEILFKLPYCKIKFLVDANIVKEKTAGVYLSELENLGILESVKVGKEKLFINKKFFILLKT